MGSKQNKLPSVLMLLLSSLGILFSIFISALVIWDNLAMLGHNDATSFETLTSLSIGSLILFIGLLNFPALIYTVKKLKGKEIETKIPSLFKRASLSMFGWLVLLAAGFWISRSQIASYALAPITILAVAIPVWWLVELARHGLKRPRPSREWDTLTVGLTVSPMIIMIIEILLVLVIGLIVVMILGLQPDTLSQIMELPNQMEFSEGSLEDLENLLFNLAQDPVIASAIFFVVGVVAPFTEELFKPLAVWILPRRSLTPRDGFVLGLISGGAFTLIESASLVSQIGSEDWLISVVMRSAAGLLHISLSGLVGYGIAKAKCEKRWGIALLNLLAASVLHGLWNSMAMLNGYSATSLPINGSASASLSNIISVVLMLLVFVIVTAITYKINTALKKQESSSNDEQEAAIA